MKRLQAGIAAVIVALSPIEIPAAASASPRAQPRSIAVSVPADPVSLNPGATSQIPIRVVNPGSKPVTVTVKGMGIHLGDNGSVRFTGAPDPQWSSRTGFPPGELTVPAQSYIDVAITVDMPTRITPDFYYIGFLVTPVATGTGVVQINQIGAFVTINVPGPRVRELSADLQAPVGKTHFFVGGAHFGDVVIGSSVAGTLIVHNIGKSSVQFWGESDANAWIGGATPTQQRIKISLLPIGRSRSFAVTSRPSFPIDVVTMTVTVTYPGTTEASTKQIVISRRFLVISPWVILVVCALVILALIWWGRRVWRKRRHSEPRRRALHAAKRSGPTKREPRPSIPVSSG